MEGNMERYRSPVLSPLFGIEPFTLFPGRRGFLDNMLDTGFSLSGLTELFDSDFGVKIVDKEDRKIYQFGLPGIKKENISVDISGHVLSVKVSQQEEDSSRSYSSKVTLASDLDLEHVEAESHNGLLSVSFPYVKKNSFKVEITSGDSTDEKIAVQSSGGEEVKEAGESRETGPNLGSNLPQTPDNAPKGYQI